MYTVITLLQRRLVTMPGGHGQRARTRDLFSRPFRGKGYIPLSTYLRTYKIGDYVDVKVNAAVQKVRSWSTHTWTSTHHQQTSRRVCHTSFTTAVPASCGT